LYSLYEKKPAYVTIIVMEFKKMDQRTINFRFQFGAVAYVLNKEGPVKMSCKFRGTWLKQVLS